MTAQSELAEVLAELNASLAKLADDKTAWQALVTTLQGQVADLQTQLGAQADNVVDPATVDALQATANQIKDAVDNLNVPAPVEPPVDTPPVEEPPAETPPVTEPGTEEPAPEV